MSVDEDKVTANDLTNLQLTLKSGLCQDDLNV